MPVKFDLRRVDGQSVQQVPKSAVASEEQLEGIIEARIDILGLDKLFQIGRQVITDFGKRGSTCSPSTLRAISTSSSSRRIGRQGRLSRRRSNTASRCRASRSRLSGISTCAAAVGVNDFILGHRVPVGAAYCHISPRFERLGTPQTADDHLLTNGAVCRVQTALPDLRRMCSRGHWVGSWRCPRSAPPDDEATSIGTGIRPRPSHIDEVLAVPQWAAIEKKLNRGVRDVFVEAELAGPPAVMQLPGNM